MDMKLTISLSLSMKTPKTLIKDNLILSISLQAKGRTRKYHYNGLRQRVMVCAKINSQKRGEIFLKEYSPNNRNYIEGVPSMRGRYLTSQINDSNYLGRMQDDEINLGNSQINGNVMLTTAPFVMKPFPFVKYIFCMMVATTLFMYTLLTSFSSIRKSTLYFSIPFVPMFSLRIAWRKSTAATILWLRQVVKGLICQRHVVEDVTNEWMAWLISMKA